MVLIVSWILGCNPRNAGPVGSFFNGSYKLEAYTVNGIKRPISEAMNYTYLETTPDRDTIFFVFKDALKKVSKREALYNTNFDVNRDRSVGTYWFKTMDNRNGRVILTWDVPKNIPIRLDMSTFMSGDFNVRADSVRYHYIPNP